MQLLTPGFTFQFKCIADKCTYSCCKGWSILFEEDERDNFLQFGINDIDSLSIRLGPHRYKMRNDSNGNCPYLEDSGLCHMITSCGSDAVLCYTCKSFPRFTNPKNQYIEYTLSNACPAVIDILSATPCPITFEVIDCENSIEYKIHFPDNLIVCRDTMIDLMQIHDFPVWLRLYIIYTFARKIKNQAESDTYSIIEQYNSVDYLIEMCNELLSIDINLPTKLQLMVNYLNIVHVKNSTDIHERYYAQLFSEALEIDIDYLSESFIQFENIYSQYSSLMENIVVNDIFRKTNCNSSEDLYYSTIMMIIMMSLIKFSLFLEYLNSDKEDIYNLNYNIIVYFARKFEHISFIHIKNQAIEFEKKEWLAPGNIFTLLR